MLFYKMCGGKINSIESAAFNPAVLIFVVSVFLFWFILSFIFSLFRLARFSLCGTIGFSSKAKVFF
jgi:hypothetical protein